MSGQHGHSTSGWRRPRRASRPRSTVASTTSVIDLEECTMAIRRVRRGWTLVVGALLCAGILSACTSSPTSASVTDTSSQPLAVQWMSSSQLPEHRRSTTRSVCIKVGPGRPRTYSFSSREPRRQPPTSYPSPNGSSQRPAVGRSGRSSAGRICSRTSPSSICTRSTR